jgi:hypothetical protein
MPKICLQEEAASCRRMSREFVGRPEEPFLLRLASTMDQLALIRAPSREGLGAETSAT